MCRVLYVYSCVCVSECVLMWVCGGVCVCMYICIYVYKCVCMCVYSYVSVHVCVYTLWRTCAGIYMCDVCVLIPLPLCVWLRATVILDSFV